MSTAAVTNVTGPTTSAAAATTTEAAATSPAHKPADAPAPHAIADAPCCDAGLHRPAASQQVARRGIEKQQAHEVDVIDQVPPLRAPVARDHHPLASARLISFIFSFLGVDGNVDQLLQLAAVCAEWADVVFNFPPHAFFANPHFRGTPLGQVARCDWSKPRFEDALRRALSARHFADSLQIVHASPFVQRCRELTLLSDTMHARDFIRTFGPNHDDPDEEWRRQESRRNANWWRYMDKPSSSMSSAKERTAWQRCDHDGTPTCIKKGRRQRGHDEKNLRGHKMRPAWWAL